MKINKLAMVLGSVMAMSVCVAHADDKKPVSVQGGTVHFRGSLVDAACSVSADSADQTVTLGQYTLHHFKKAGDTASAIPFKIKLEDCDTSVASTAAVTFSGQPDLTTKDLFAINSSEKGNGTMASGVGIRILDETSTKVVPNGTSAKHTLINGENTLLFSAQYVATSATPTAGLANADATFIMQYQ